MVTVDSVTIGSVIQLENGKWVWQASKPFITPEQKAKRYGVASAGPFDRREDAINMLKRYAWGHDAARGEAVDTQNLKSALRLCVGLLVRLRHRALMRDVNLMNAQEKALMDDVREASGIPTWQFTGWMEAVEKEEAEAKLKEALQAG
jgi:hypothetical protein